MAESWWQVATRPEWTFSARNYMTQPAEFGRTTGNLNIARRSHTATLLPNGQVLVAGGVNSSGVLLPRNFMTQPLEPGRSPAA